jgi:hypothetical protein
MIGGTLDNWQRLFDLFLSEKIYLAYAKRHLAANQIGVVDTSRYLAARES